MKVGKAKYGGQKKVFKIKDGDNVYRILPPLGKLADAGKWSQYYRVEWGYKGSDGKMKPFQDVRVVNRQTKMVEVESAAYLRREALKNQKNQLVADFKNGKATKEQVQEAIDLVKRYNLDSKHYVNAVNLQGEIGLLKIGHKAKLSLEDEIKALRERGVDPLSVDNGRYFNFRRSGTGLDTTYNVSTYKENVQAVVNGETQTLLQEKKHAMDDAFISRLEAEAFELSDMYPNLTPEQVEELVSAGDNHAALVDQYLGKSSSTEGTVEEETTTVSTEKKVETSTTQETIESAPATSTVETNTTVSSDEGVLSAEDEEFLKEINANV